jgi:glycosyltransferase involved in cell wall biosynthesis
MDIQQIKVGYSPYSSDCKGPGDRRRFIFYAKEKKINFEIADPSCDYNLIYITSSANISDWIKYKKKNPSVKLVFEIIDSYLLEDDSFALYLKGLSRLLTKRESSFYLDYRNAFINIIKIADAVVCATSIQRENILRYNKNVHVSLDYFTDDINHVKTSYSKQSKLKIAWEGMAYTVDGLLQLNDVFAKLSNDIELHVITDPIIKYPFQFLNKNTETLLSGLRCQWQLHTWEKNSFSKLISQMDIAVIPINTNNKLAVNKPENKLLLLWEIGMPVITSNTPAYSRVMDIAGINSYCNSANDWLEKIIDLKSESLNREAYMQKANKYISAFHTKEILIKKWDLIFSSVL